nr:hypothetical protein [Tanacetum cinerariifolium]
MKSILTQSALDALSEKFHILDTVHPELPGPNDRIRNSPTEMDLLAVIHHADPTKVQIGEKQVGEGEVPLLQLTRGRAVPLAAVNEQGNQIKDVQDAVVHVVNKGPKVQKKRRIADGANGFNHAPKKLREDHNTSGYVSVGTGGNSLVVIQELFEQSTLNVEAEAAEAICLHGQIAIVEVVEAAHSSELDSSHDSSANDEDNEITSIVRSFVPPPLIMTAAIATTVIASAISA